MKIEPFTSNDLTQQQIDFAKLYLTHYGYTQDDIESEIKRFQNMFNVKVDGVIGPQTLKAMAIAPRCGFTDAQNININQPKWGIKNITWCFDGQWLHPDQDDIISKALKNWSDIIDLQFTKIADKTKANILITSSSDVHQGLGTPGNILGFAYFPESDNWAGQSLVVIDLSERWIKYGEVASGIELEDVLTHEFGHTWGFEHSLVPSALMAPTYAKGRNKPVSPDDVERALKVYNPAIITPTNPPSNPPGQQGITIFIPGGKVL